MPRPTRLTPDIAKTILDALTIGALVKDACAAVNLSDRRFREWVERGNAALALVERIEAGEKNEDGSPLEPPPAGEQLYAEFALQAERARADARISALSRVRKGEKGWQGSAWFLERSDRKSWGRRLEHSGPDGAPIRIQPMAQMTDEQLAAIAAGAALVGGDPIDADDGPDGGETPDGA